MSFAKYGLFYRALLQKRPIILRSLLIVAIPYLIAYAATQYRTTHCNTKKQNTLQYTATQYSATHCNKMKQNTLQHTATHLGLQQLDSRHTALQHTATHRNTLQHTAPRCNTLYMMSVSSRIHIHTLSHQVTSHKTRVAEKFRSRVQLLQAQVYCSVLQCAAVCCSMLRCVAACCSVLRCVAVQCV